MKTSYLRILPLLLAAVVVAACSSDITPEEPQNPLFGPTDSDEPVPVEFRVSAQHTGDFTRATESIVTFTSGEAVKVCVSTDGGDNYTPYDFTADETAQSTDLSAPTTGDKPYFPAGSTSSVKAYAYYPASAADDAEGSPVLTSSTTFSVQDDQTSEAGYKASDLMYCANQTITKPTTSATLSMAHKMAQLKITAQAQTGSGLSVNRVLVSAKKSVTFTPASGTATATGDNGDIVALTATGTGYILIPVQQISNVQIKIETGTAGDAATTATFTFGATDNFEAGNSYPIDLTISAAQLGGTTSISDWNGQQPVNYAPTGDLTIEPISPVTYDDTAKQPTVVVRKAGTDITSYCDLQYFNNTNAGTAIVVAQGKSGSDYEGSVAVATFTINKANASVSSAPTKNTSLTYNKSAQELVSAGTPSGGTMMYKLDDGEYSSSIPTAINANPTTGYTVTYYVAGDANHNDTEPVPISGITIAKKAITSSDITLASQTLTYNGSIQTRNVASVDGLTDASNWTVSGNTGTNASTSYSLTVTMTDACQNYTGSANKTWSIDKKAATITLSSAAVSLKDNATATFTATLSEAESGTSVTATSGNTTYYTASAGTLSNKESTITITGRSAGTANCTVSASSTNYSYTNVTKSITVTASIATPVKGHYLNKDGSITSSRNTSGTNQSMAYIAYVGNVPGYFDSFIAIALEDAHTTYTTYSDAQSKVGTYASSHAITYCGTTYNSNTGSTGSNCYDSVTNSTSTASRIKNSGTVKGWRIPTVTDWRYIFDGLGNGTPSATSPVGVEGGATYGTGSTLRSNINTACGNAQLQSGGYWSSSEVSGVSSDAWLYLFNYSYFYDYYKTNNSYVRAVFAY